MAEEIKDEKKDETIDIQAEVEKARKQERDKLHADIERLKAEVAEKAKTCNENYVTISNLQKELETHKKLLGEVDSKVAKAKEDGKVEASKDLDALKAELEDYKAKLAKAEKDFSDYKAREEFLQDAKREPALLRGSLEWLSRRASYPFRELLFQHKQADEDAGKQHGACNHLQHGDQSEEGTQSHGFQRVAAKGCHNNGHDGANRADQRLGGGLQALVGQAVNQLN